MPTIKGRIRFLAGGISIMALIFAGRLFYIQIVEGATFARLAENQHESAGQYAPYERGSIYWRERSGELLTAAGLESGFILAINPSLITDATSTYEALASAYPSVDREDFMRKASKRDDPYEEIAHRVSGKDKNSIEILALDGVALYREQWRDYPGGSMAAHAIGFVGYFDEDFGGRYGVESYYDRALKREPADIYQNFFSGLFDGIASEVFGNSVDDDANLTLTIEPRVQAILESKADELSERWSSKQLGIAVMNPQNGEIVGMTARPTFNPNEYGKAADASVYTNPFSQEVFEMGSIMKPITLAAALDAGKIDASTIYDDKGTIELDGKKISNFDGRARGRVNMQEVLNQSLNTGAAYAALSLGKSKFREYMQRFGLQDKTDVDLPHEVGNLLENLESDKEVEIATASFGQGIAVSPLSMMRALSALGNGGFLYKPHVLAAKGYELGYIEEMRTTEQGRAISRQTSEEITRMLVKVVDEHLSGGRLKMSDYSIAAKTGTAQIADPDGGGYYSDRFMHSFFGYFPAYEPRFLVFLFMVEPRGANYASETLTEPFGDIAKFLLNYYEVPPDR